MYNIFYKIVHDLDYPELVEMLEWDIKSELYGTYFLHKYCTKGSGEYW